MLPTVLENLIGTFAYGQETPLSEELETLIKFRECVPPCLLLPEVSWLDPHRHGRCLNPWYRGMPYTPFGLLGHEPPFVPGMLYLSRSMCKQVFSTRTPRCSSGISINFIGVIPVRGTKPSRFFCDYRPRSGRDTAILGVCWRCWSSNLRGRNCSRLVFLFPGSPSQNLRFRLLPSLASFSHRVSMRAGIFLR